MPKEQKLSDYKGCELWKHKDAFWHFHPIEEDFSLCVGINEYGLPPRLGRGYNIVMLRTWLHPDDSYPQNILEFNVYSEAETFRIVQMLVAMVKS